VIILFSERMTAGRNHLLPTGIGERYSQTIPIKYQAALLRLCELPL